MIYIKFQQTDVLDICNKSLKFREKNVKTVDKQIIKLYRNLQTKIIFYDENLYFFRIYWRNFKINLLKKKLLHPRNLTFCGERASFYACGKVKEINLSKRCG